MTTAAKTDLEHLVTEAALDGQSVLIYRSRNGDGPAAAYTVCLIDDNDEMLDTMNECSSGGTVMEALAELYRVYVEGEDPE